MAAPVKDLVPLAGLRNIANASAVLGIRSLKQFSVVSRSRAHAVAPGRIQLVSLVTSPLAANGPAFADWPRWSQVACIVSDLRRWAQSRSGASTSPRRQHLKAMGKRARELRSKATSLLTH